MFCDASVGSPPDDNVAIADGSGPMAATLGKSYTGVIAMLAGGPVDFLCLRQHLRAPDSHTAEVTAGGTAVNHGYPIRGLLHELGILMLEPTPIYCDSISTIFVARNASSIKRSVWILRRAAVLREAVDAKEFKFVKIADADNCADALTKAVTAAKLLHLLSHTHHTRAP